MSGAPNLDAMTSKDLMEFWSDSRRGWKLARSLFPDRPKNYVRVTCDLGHYAANKATAMTCREHGNINSAVVYERICDAIYDRLPTWARW